MISVNLCHTGTIALQGARELEIMSGLVCRWKRGYATNKEGSFSEHSKAVMTDGELEIVPLT